MSVSLPNRWPALLAGMLCAFALIALAVPVAASAGQIVEIGKNTRQEIVGTVGQLFTAMLACAAFWLFWKRHYTEMAVMAIAGAVVAWVVFSPDSAAQQLKGIVAELFTVKK